MNIRGETMNDLEICKARLAKADAALKAAGNAFDRLPDKKQVAGNRVYDRYSLAMDEYNEAKAEYGKARDAAGVPK